MKLELFTNENEFEDYMKIATFSVLPDDAKIPVIYKKFGDEITIALNHTKSLRKNFKYHMDLGFYML